MASAFGRFNRSEREIPLETVAIASFISLIALAVIGRGILAYVGIAKLAFDATEVWIPMGESVLAGTEPYSEFPDNKPPLFIFLTVIASAVGYAPIMTVLGGVANSVIVLEVYRWLREEGQTVAGVLAAGIMTIVILGIIVNHNTITNKSVSLAVLLLTLRYRNPVHLGIGVGIAGLIAQQTIIAAPLIAWYRCRSIDDFAKFSLSGIAVAAVTFAAVGGIWGVDALRASIEQSLLLIMGYTAGTAEMGRQIPLWNDPAEWAIVALKSQIPLILPGVVGTLGVVYGYSKGSLSKKRVFEVGLAVSFLALLFVRPWWHYGYYPAIPFSILGGWGASLYLEDVREATR